MIYEKTNVYLIIFLFFLMYYIRIDKKMNKICNLIEMTQKEIKKSVNSNSENETQKETSLKTFLELKRFYEINSLCTLEIFHELQSLGLVSIGMALILLFQSFKMQMNNILRMTLQNFKNKGLFFEEGEEQDKKEPNNFTPLMKQKSTFVLFNFNVKTN